MNAAGQLRARFAAGRRAATDETPPPACLRAVYGLISCCPITTVREAMARRLGARDGGR